MNHKWDNDTCRSCGIKREKRESTIILRTHSRLSRSGIFEDVPVYDTRMRWHYFDLDGQGIGIHRPDCKNINHEKKEP